MLPYDGSQTAETFLFQAFVGTKGRKIDPLLSPDFVQKTLSKCAPVENPVQIGAPG